jgi:hypothetical protein
MNGNSAHLYVFISNPYLWLFVSALFMATALARLASPVKKNIYQKIVAPKRLRSLLLNALMALLILAVGMVLFGDNFVFGSTPLLVYYLIVLLPAFLLIRFAPQTIYLIFLLMGISAYASMQVKQQWTLVNPITFQSESVMGLFAYSNIGPQADLVVMHASHLHIDRQALALHWQDIAPVANLYASYASYPKGEVNYWIRGYVMQSRPEFFFLYPARYLYPLEFEVFNSRSNVGKEPKMLWYLKLMRPITGLREFSWDFNAEFVSEQSPILLYPQTQRGATIPLTLAQRRPQPDAETWEQLMSTEDETYIDLESAQDEAIVSDES